MNIQEKLRYYVETFSNDPLYKTIQSNDDNWLKELFSDPIYFDKVTFENTYSTKQAAELLGIEGKEQTFLNYINRNDCNWYLDVSRQTRFYRYDWKSLFRFKMIFLLNEKGFSPMNIAGEIGTKLVVSSVNPEETYPKKDRGVALTNDDLQLDIKQVTIKNTKILLDTLQAFDKYRNEKDKLQEEKMKIEQELLRAKEEIDTLEARIDDMNDYIDLFKSTHSTNLNKNEGLFSKLLGKKNNKEQQDLEFNNQIQKLEDKLEKMNEKKKRTFEIITEYELKHKELVFDLNALNESPHEYRLLLEGFQQEIEGSGKDKILESEN